MILTLIPIPVVPVLVEMEAPEDLAEIGRWLAGAKAYFIQKFVDSGDLIASGLQALSDEEMEALLRAVLPYIPNTRLRGVS